MLDLGWIVDQRNCELKEMCEGLFYIYLKVMQYFLEEVSPLKFPYNRIYCIIFESNMMR